MVLEGEGRSWVWRALEGRREEEKVGAEIKVVEPGTRLYQLLTSILFFFSCHEVYNFRKPAR